MTTEAGTTGAPLAPSPSPSSAPAELHVTEVDGVTTVWAPTPGPLRAGLMLRVGAADETVTTAGVTHLMEHLALFGVGRPGDHSNGQVDATVTGFQVVGEPERVTGFLSQVTRQLVEPPVHRVPAEVGILRAERDGRRHGVFQDLLMWRYGSTGYGLQAQAEHGLRRVDGSDLTAWSRRYATRGNAVLWLSGPPPAGLRLHLPDGALQDPPDPYATILPRRPAWFPGPPDGAALMAVVPRGFATVALAHVLRSRLVDELRTTLALAYSPSVDYSPLTGTAGRLTAVTDLVPARATEATVTFVAALRALAGLGPDGGEGGLPVRPHELQEWLAHVEREGSEPLAPLGTVLSAAWEALFGRDLDAVRTYGEQRARLQPQDVTAVARAALDEAVAQLPCEPGSDRWSPAPVTSLPAVPGREHVSLDAAVPHQRLVVAPRAVTLTDRGEHLSAVPEQTEAVLRWPDGARVLITREATRLVVEPTLWVGGRQVVEQIDREWPPETVVEMEPRAVQEIPRPTLSRRNLWWRRHHYRVCLGAILVWATAWTVTARVLEDRGFDPPTVLVGMLGSWAVAGVYLRVRPAAAPSPG